MGFRFRKQIKIVPGVKLNVGKKGINSFSVGGKGFTKNISKHGTRTTVGIPGTGISYTEYHKRNNKSKAATNVNGPSFTKKTVGKITELAENWRECDIYNKQDKIPYPGILIKEWVAIIILGALGFAVHPAMFVFAMIPALMALWSTLFNKQMKAKNNQFYAIKAFHLSNFNECIERCEKSLKYKEYKSTKHLLKEAQEELNKTCGTCKSHLQSISGYEEDEDQDCMCKNSNEDAREKYHIDNCPECTDDFKGCPYWEKK